MRIHGQNGLQKSSNALLDSGTQVSLIKINSSSTGTQRKGHLDYYYQCRRRRGNYQNQNLQGSSASADHTEKFSIKAVAIPCISEDVAPVQLKPIAELLGIKGERSQRGKGPVDLLIGIDHAQIHIGETKQSGKLVARNTLLGWVVFWGFLGWLSSRHCHLSC